MSDSFGEALWLLCPRCSQGSTRTSRVVQRSCAILAVWGAPVRCWTCWIGTSLALWFGLQCMPQCHWGVHLCETVKLRNTMEHPDHDIGFFRWFPKILTAWFFLSWLVSFRISMSSGRAFLIHYSCNDGLWILWLRGESCSSVTWISKQCVPKIYGEFLTKTCLLRDSLA